MENLDEYISSIVFSIILRIGQNKHRTKGISAFVSPSIIYEADDNDDSSRVSKFVVNLRKVSNRAHPSFFLVHSVPPTHQPPQPQHCLLSDKEVNCNYQSLSLPRTHSPLFDTFLSPSPLHLSLLSPLLPWLLGSLSFPLSFSNLEISSPRNNFATTATTTQPWPSSSTIKRIHVAR